ncbi:unnamed protein product [Pedinophyceae sp. YPF-701]|nr:unnamed protein product [Pedinophyceae sp. YPF-701]
MGACGSKDVVVVAGTPGAMPDAPVKENAAKAEKPAAPVEVPSGPQVAKDASHADASADTPKAQEVQQAPAAAAEPAPAPEAGAAEPEAEPAQEEPAEAAQAAEEPEKPVEGAQEPQGEEPAAADPAPEAAAGEPETADAAQDGAAEDAEPAAEPEAAGADVQASVAETTGAEPVLGEAGDAAPEDEPVTRISASLDPSGDPKIDAIVAKFVNDLAAVVVDRYARLRVRAAFQRVAVDGLLQPSHVPDFLSLLFGETYKHAGKAFQLRAQESMRKLEVTHAEEDGITFEDLVARFMRDMDENFVERVNREFEKLDTDMDGYVSPQELKDAVKRHTGMALNDEQTRQLIKVFDLDNDGKVSKGEFTQLLATTRLGGATTAVIEGALLTPAQGAALRDLYRELAESFEMFCERVEVDGEKKQVLGVEQIVTILEQRDVDIDADKAQAMLERVAAKTPGKVDVGEWAHLAVIALTQHAKGEEDRAIKEARRAFATFDQNHNGFISTEELHDVLCREFSDGEASQKAAAGLVEKMDIRKDHQIDLEEFLVYCMRLEADASFAAV